MDQKTSRFAVVSAESGSVREQVACPVCEPQSIVFIGKSNNLPIVGCCSCDRVYVSEYVPMDSTWDFCRDKHMKDSDATRLNSINDRQKGQPCEDMQEFYRDVAPRGLSAIEIPGHHLLFFLSNYKRTLERECQRIEYLSKISIAVWNCIAQRRCVTRPKLIARGLIAV